MELASDQDALDFHQHFLPKIMPLKHAPTRRKLPSRVEVGSNPPPQKTITMFWAALSTIAHIQELRGTPEKVLNHNLFLKKLFSDTQQTWILSKLSLENFKSFIDLQNMLTVTLSHNAESLPLDNNYAQFADFHDQAHLTTGNHSWIQVLKSGGMEGIEAKLHEYWQPKNQPPHQPLSDDQKLAYIQKYIAAKLLPMFHTHLLAQVLEIEMQADDIAWESWQQIQQWNQEEQKKLGIMRLCGNWKWIIHNHQNHGDHKSTMTFYPPEIATPSQIQPSTILINGDTVYLKWSFPQGIQEDSLLLSNDDTRLEGTFTNSLGPYGSISGQRLSSCQ